MTSVPIEQGLFFASVLFAIGLFGVLLRRNIIFTLMSIEIMLNASGVVFVLAGALHGRTDGQVMFLFILALAAAEVSVGLALIFRMHHRFRSLDIDSIGRLRG